jgi:hypothetical protein
MTREVRWIEMLCLVSFYFFYGPHEILLQSR